MKKILIGITTILLLLLLLQISFWQRTTNFLEKIDYGEIKNGNYLLDIEENILSFKTGISEDGLNINYISPFDKVLYMGDMSIEGNNINIGKGVYLINISELNSKWMINGEGFLIENNGPTIIFIDSSGTRTNIFSQNTIVSLKLIDETNNDKVVNNVYLYPHTFIRFMPNLNKNIEGADISKLTQFFPLNYFGEKIFDGDAINESFISNVIGDKNENIEIIRKMFMFLKLAYNEEEKTLTSLKSVKFGTINGEKMLKTYGSLFLNDIKKSVYDKNLTLRGIGDLMNSTENKEQEINFLVDIMNEIKGFNQKDYEEIKNILYFYTDLILNSYNVNLNTRLNFSKLYNLLENKNFSFSENPLISLGDIYSKLDIKVEDNIQKYNEMYEKLNNSALVLNLNNSSLSENSQSYLISFLYNIIIYGFNLNVDIKNILNIFNEYTSISYNYYSNGDDVRIRTGIVEYSKVLEKFFVKINEYFFQDDRDEKGYLVLKKQNPLTNSEITKLRTNVNKIISYYGNNKDKLLDKEKSYGNTLNDLEKISDEYFKAISDYTSYLSTDLLIYLSSTGKENILSVDLAKKYLEQFNYLNLSNVKISLRNSNYCNSLREEYDVDELEEPHCYKVENLVINNKVKLDFILVPSDYNEISNIVIDGDSNKNRGSYKLDREKEDLSKQLQTTSSGNRDVFLFENYFFYKFGGGMVTVGPVVMYENDECEIPIEIPQETPAIKAIKSSLLGGELNNIGGGLIVISYNNLIVSEIDLKYNFEIRNAKFNYAKNNTNEKYNGCFNSKYIFEEKVFENPEISIYNDRGSKLLAGNKVNFVGKFKITEVKNDFISLFNNLSILSNVLNDINNNLGISQLTITYSSDNNIDLRNEELQIYIKGNQITSVVYNSKKLISRPIEISDLNEALQLMK